MVQLFFTFIPNELIFTEESSSRPTYLEDDIAIVVGLDVVQSHDAWQVERAVDSAGQLAAVVKLSDVLRGKGWVQHVLYVIQ